MDKRVVCVLTLYITAELLCHFREGLGLVQEGGGLRLQLPHLQLSHLFQESLQSDIGVHGDVEGLLHNDNGVGEIDNGSYCSTACRQAGIEGAKQREIRREA